jgi:hypothetical protein
MHEVASEWRQLKLGLIDEREAGTIIPHLIYLNLYAQIDEELGSAQSKERRQVTMDVLDSVYKRFEDKR